MCPGNRVPRGSLLGFLISGGGVGLVQRWVVLAQNAFPREERDGERDLYMTGPGIVLCNYTFVRAWVRVNSENGVMPSNRFGFQNGRPSSTGLAENYLHGIPSEIPPVRFSPVFVPAEVARPPLKRTAPIVSFGFRVNRTSMRWNIRNIFDLLKPRGTIQSIREIRDKNLCSFFERKKVIFWNWFGHIWTWKIDRVLPVTRSTFDEKSTNILNTENI